MTKKLLRKKRAPMLRRQAWERRQRKEEIRLRKAYREREAARGDAHQANA